MLEFDENNNVIIGVRSQYGIHLMVIEKSMYEFAEPDGTNKTSSSLATYYSTKIPGDTGYNPDSYVGYIESPNTEDYKKRADDVKSKITSFDSTYDYRLFTWLTTSTAQGGEGINITFTGAAEGLGDKLEQYIESQKANNANKQEEGLASVWKTYTRLLEAQKADREAEPWTVINPTNGQFSPKLTRLASEAIAVDFYALYTGKDANNVDLNENALKGLYEKFAEGGSYYYYA